MGLFSVDGRFGGGASNPQYMGVQRTGFEHNTIPLTEQPGPFGGRYVPGRGWENFAGQLQRGRQTRGPADAVWSRLRKLLEIDGRDGSDGPLSVPDPWKEGAPTEGMIDPSAVIRASRPRIQEERGRGWAQAAARMGELGGLTSGEYGTALGGVQRKADADLAEIVERYLYQAAESGAGRQHAADQARRGREFGGWQTHGGWQMAAQDEELRQLMTLLDMLRPDAAY